VRPIFVFIGDQAFNLALITNVRIIKGDKLKFWFCGDDGADEFEIKGNDAIALFAALREYTHVSSAPEDWQHGTPPVVPRPESYPDSFPITKPIEFVPDPRD
jgi:hypothetical protein